MEFKVFDSTSTDYSFVLKGFQNSGSNPATDASNSIFVEVVTPEYYVMSRNSYNVMVSPDMILATDYISDLAITQDDLVDGK